MLLHEFIWVYLLFPGQMFVFSTWLLRCDYGWSFTLVPLSCFNFITLDSINVQNLSIPILYLFCDLATLGFTGREFQRSLFGEFISRLF